MELLIIGIIALVLYGVIRIAGALLSRLTGARYRAYRLLAQRYRGRYESRGLVDPPTVSFSYNKSSVRVGLAPVVSGQPSSPRTRVVARFTQGLPLRFELIPSARPAPVQPPKGTRPVRLGDPGFDRTFVVRANDPEMARVLLSSEATRQALETLRRLAPPSGMLVSINPERLLVQVDRNLGLSTSALELAVREALVLHDHLQASVMAGMAHGIDIVEAGASDEDAGPPICKVCGDAIETIHVVCSTCRTPHHRDCWTFVGGCSIYGCQGKNCISV
ncbi:hypothetical protein BH23PLA1_BH23PLA1_18170 [soil metagenome]